MAARQAGFFVKHTEKIILAVAAAFALLLVAIAWLGVFGSPASTRINGVVVTPENVQDIVNAEADRLRSKLDETEPGVPEVQIPNYAEDFSSRIAAPILAGDPRLVSGGLDRAGLTAATFVLQQNSFPAYFLPTPPVPTDVTLKAGTAVLADPASEGDAAARERLVELRNRLDIREPGDFQFVSVMGRFPLQSWSERLEGQDPEGSRQPIPENVWRPRLGLAAVYLLRQRQDARTGAWGEPERVEVLPGQPGFLPGEPTGIEDLPQAQAAVAFLQAQQSDVAQVPFPATAHQPWTPPSGRDRVFTPEERERLAELEEDIEQLKSSIAREQGRDEPTSQPERRRPQRPERNRGGGGFGGGFAGGGFDGGFGGGPDFGGGPPRGVDRGGPSAGSDPDQRRIQRFQDELAEKQAELNDLLGVDEDLSVPGGGFPGSGGFPGGGGFDGGFGGGFDGGGFPGNMDGFAGSRGGAGTGLGTAEAAGPEEVVIWAHDLTAQPGETYRYKLLAAPINPLFRYSRVADEQREENRDRLAIAPSAEEVEGLEWTPPVTLNPLADFFFLSGNAEQDRANIEVWKVYDGLWQVATFEENPGNGIGGTETLDVRGRRQRVDLSTGALLLDIDVLQAIDRNPDTRMVYENPDGTIRSRMRQDDQESERRRLLQDRLQTQQEQLGLAG
ncbi:hypothetical protein [Phycisphaera mikurensis]|uniref:Uncharacterized protein n=1 Tax=Phycisphaera mikurensis (strain NBRC 102666 / KCTC 22515 / FYK2301M01) TaxID=1142394 RepID=I0IFS9_PHYMF|nr:hypothetical protein [Phycisphaera mikurensis]MBB6440493.1 putative membrane protein YgcG [Phycisphaera mikurensis]BAM04117.1 hypothetical protein PSMK_19580 [Phycisphaera mikurensis NBRC 102666]